MAITFLEFTTRLALGELKNTKAVMETNPGHLDSDERSRIAMLTNMGLMALHTKFNLLEKEVLLRTRAGISRYFLRSSFARSNPQNRYYKYVDDTIYAPFEDDLIKILRVYDETGTEMYVDDLHQDESVFTVSYDCIQIPYVHLGSMFSVIYQAKHPPLDITDPCQPLYIPPVLEEALQLFVAGKYFEHMNGPEHTQKGQSYMQQYASMCSEVELNDSLRTSNVTTSTKAEQRGFV